MALNALRDITISLQRSMLKELGKALDDDGMDDFSAVVNASDTGRAMTVNVLNDLFLRMQSSVASGRGLQQIPENQADGWRGEIDSSISQLQIGPSQAAPKRVWTIQSTEETGAVAEQRRSPPSPTNKQARESKGVSYFPRWRKRSDTSPVPENDSGSDEQASPLAARPTPQDFDQQQGDIEKTLTHDSNSTTDDSRAAQSPAVILEDRTETGKPRRTATNSDQPRRGWNLRRESTDSPALQGFCKGAYYLQVRLKKDGVRLKNQSGSFQGEDYYYACSNSKCCFEAPARKTRKNWDFGDKVLGPFYGVSFRWSFLAKSHIEQGKVKNKQYQYRCIFCALQKPETPVLMGIKGLMEHVSQHQDEPLITENRVIVDGEGFDIQFPIEGQPGDVASVGSEPSIQEVPPWTLDYDRNPWNNEGEE